MIDEDGFERPDDPNAHGRKLVEGKRKIKFNGRYNFYPRSPFFRVWMNLLKGVALPIAYPFFTIGFKVNVVGKENLKKIKGQPCVVTTNHVHVFDVVGIGVNVLPERRIYTTTLQTSIKRHFVGFWMRSVGCIPIPINSVDGMKKYEADLEKILKKKNGCIAFAPEGSLWPKYRGIRPFKKGAFSLAVKNSVKILPVALTFRRKKRKNGKYRYLFTYIVGSPLERNADIANENDAILDLQNRTHEWYEKTLEEWYKENTFEK